MKKRQESCSLLIHVALQDGLANCEMIVCLVCFSFGLLVPGLWRNSVVVFASTHERGDSDATVLLVCILL